MTTVANAVQQRKVDDTVAKDVAEFIPETIEEMRKDSEGRAVVTKYIRGKLLGKVCNFTKVLFKLMILVSRLLICYILPVTFA